LTASALGLTKHNRNDCPGEIPIVEKIIAGVNNFRRTEYVENREFFEQLAAKQQKPMALFITCSDSRVHPNLITQTEPGDLFLIRNAGNIIPPHGANVGGEARRSSIPSKCSAFATSSSAAIRNVGR
jgi:hypothetical protein